MGLPARGYTRTHPPFEAGNSVAERHGAWSPRRFEPLAGELVAQMLALAGDRVELGYLAAPQYAPALWAWARAEAKIQLIEEWLADNGGELDNDGVPRPATALRERLERRALKSREMLGLDPLSKARLGRDVAAASVDTARLMAELNDDQGDVVDVEATDESGSDG